MITPLKIVKLQPTDFNFQAKSETEEAASTNKHTQTPSACSDSRMLPDVVGSSTAHNISSDDEESGVHFRTLSQTSFDDIDFHRSMPGTPTKLTEL